MKLSEKRFSEEKEAIEHCENTRIHDVGYIQPFGHLLAVIPETLTITHASENCSDWFGFSLDQILGKSLSQFFSKEIIHHCNNAVAHQSIAHQRERVGRAESNGMHCDIFAHLKQERFILELQQTRHKEDSGIKSLDYVQHALHRMSSSMNVQALLVHAVEELRFISQFDRVKFYKFLADGAGEVIAESKNPSIESYLGLRFPASDVPKAARKLYATTPIRIIPSVSAEPIKIHALDAAQPALDLSLALFRGVVPVHLMYLQNMKIESSISLPIVIDGEMWGLFAFHHLEERMLDAELLAALEILGSAISMMVSTILQKQQLTITQECSRVVSKLFIPDESIMGFKTFWGAAGPELANLLKCDGVGLLGDDIYETFGTCLSNVSIQQLSKHLDEDFNNDGLLPKPIPLDAIAANYPSIVLGNIAGVMAIPIPIKSYQYLFYFRKEINQNVRWAGSISKKIEHTKEGFRLNPRASFAEYVESKHQQSDAFNENDISVAQVLENALMRIKDEHQERLGLIVRELNHRVKNTLALVGSIVSQSRTTEHSLETFILCLKERLFALSETQKLLTEHEWRPIEIHNLLYRSLISFRDYLDSRIILVGQAFILPANLASLFSLVIYELASNAEKYGALSNAKGIIEINWNYYEGILNIQWKETGGPMVRQPSSFGFGSTLIKEALSYESNGSCQMHFLQSGVEVNFSIPLEKFEILKLDANNSSELPKVRSQDFNVLVLEDDYIIGKETSNMLKEMGASKVDMVPSIQQAISCAGSNTYDLAILDANIRGEFSGSVAKLLKKKDIPFAFATGYGSKDRELKQLKSLAILSKPIEREKLMDVLKRVKPQ